MVIRYRHTDPDLAQKIADTLADVFVNSNQLLQESGTSKATQDLAQEIAKYQDQVHQKEQSVFAYAKQYELPADFVSKSYPSTHSIIGAQQIREPL